MRKIFAATLILIFAQTALADFSTVKCLSLKETAEELLNIEASGRQHPDSTCMVAESFPRYRVGRRISGGGDTEDTRQPVILTGKKPFKIKSVKSGADDRHVVSFEYNLPDGKTISDEFEFVQYQSGELKKFFGCAAFATEPKTLAIHAACLPKK